MIRAAWLYYERRLNQQDIADRLGVSRSTVSRLLSGAEEAGIVRVTVTEQLPEAGQLAEQLHERFGIRANVEPLLAGSTPIDSAAIAMARRLEAIAASGTITIAAGWGRTLHLAARKVRTVKTSGVHLVDAFGHTTTEPMSAAVEVTNELSQRFRSTVTHMPAPGFADDAEIAAKFFASVPVADALRRAREADAVILSVGVTGPSSLLLECGYLGQSEMDELMRQGAVGEVFGVYFDHDGRQLDYQPLAPISLGIDELQASRWVIAAAGGAEKQAAILGAIRGGIITELATDTGLAQALLNS